MSDLAIKVENLSKFYRLGQVGTGTISHDLNRWWHKFRGNEDPYLKLGQENKRDVKGGQFVWALKDINFNVSEGDVLGIIGKNGAGKSTLLKLLSRVTAPTTGSIKINGRIASLLEVGTGFHPELTGRENVFLNGAILGMSKAEIQSNFDEIVDFAGVERYIDTPVKRYSSGMYVRLAFAVAAHLDPEVLIIDEVLAVGDSDFQKKCKEKISSINQEKGKTILFVSHNMNLIREICTKGLLMERGKVTYSGSIHDTISEFEKSIDNLKLDFSTRQFNKSAQITGVDVMAEDGNLKDMIVCGESFSIKVYFKTREFFKELELVIIIADILGNRILVTRSRENCELKDIESGGSFEAFFEHLNIMPGIYLVQLALKYRGQNLDFIDNARELIFTGGGKSIHDDNGMIYYEPIWKANSIK